MPKDGDKKKKKHSHGRKRRIQLDDDKDVSYYRHFVTSTLADSSIATRSSTDSAHRSKSASTEMPTADAERPSTSSQNTDLSTSTRPDQQKKTNETNNGATESSSTLARPVSTSPEPNCAICLGKLENKSFTDSCFHQFCFDCLVEWSKVKAECPLCKQPFKSIVHNVRSYNDYDQYHIPRPEERVSFPEHIFGTNPGVRFRYRTTVTDHRYAHVADRISREIELRLLQRPSRSSPIPNYRRLCQPANSDFRRRIYHEHLQLSLQEHNTRRRVRETSPTFFQNNPAQTHRLVPWLNRELNALLQGGQQVAFILDLIIDLIKRYPIDSEEFYQHVFPYTGRYTRHFMREFMMFAKSPYHMAAYDRHCSYEPSNERNHDSDSESDHQRPGSQEDGNDSDVIVCDGDRSSPWTTSASELFDHMRPPSHPAMGDFFLPSNLPRTRALFDEPFQGSYFTNICRGYYRPSTVSSSSLSSLPGTSVQPPTLSHIGETISDSLYGTDPWTSLGPQQGTSATDSFPLQTEPIICNETGSDSSTSDVEIVDIEKPWHERSPIQLSSAEDSDSDVMITGMTYLNDPIKKEKKKKKDKHHHDNQSIDRKSEKRKRRSDSSRDRHDAKRPLISESAEVSSRSRSRSISPLRLTIIRSPDYQHKKFMYKAHGDAIEMRKSGHRDHRSTSCTDSDSESQHVSITSHRHKSKTNSSSIEIVEYRKKRSKSKKNKKHKKDKKHEDILENENLSDGRHHKKHKTHSKSSLVLDRGSSKSGHSSSGSHSRNKHKSKKKKHHKSSRDKESKSSKTPAMIVGDKKSNKNNLNIYTSDSDLDSDIDVETISQKASDPSVRGDGFAEPGVEFVELNAAQAAVIDQELDHINKTLANNDYITTLMTDGNSGARKDTQCFENNDPNRLVNPDDVLNLRSFKKHPYGHKKSNKNGKSSTIIGTSSSERHNLVNSISQLSHGHALNSTDNIQISDISSCTDTDIDRQLPSFLTFSNRSSDSLHHGSGMPNPFDSHQRRIANILSTNSCSQIDQLLINESSAYESPTSTELPSVRACSGEIDKDSDVIDVDTLDSDVDDSVSNLDAPSHSISYEPNFSSVMRTNSGGGEDAVKSYKTSCSSIKLKEIDTSCETSDDGAKTNDPKIGTIEPNSSSILKANLETSLNAMKSYKTSCNSIKINNSKIDTINVVDIANGDDNVNGDSFESDDSKTGSNFQNLESKNDSEIDVENEDSDLECSLVEGHKTFQIDADSDSEVINVGGSGVDIDVVGYSDEDIDVEECEQDEVVSGGTDEKMLLDVNSDIDSRCDDVVISTSPKAYVEVSQERIDKDQMPSGSTQNSEKSEHELDSESEYLSEENAIDETDLMYDENGLLNKEESDSDESVAANITNLNSSGDSPEEAADSVTKESVTTSTYATFSTISSSESALNWTSQSVYEARPLGMSGSSDAVFQECQSGTPEHYVIDSPSNVNLSPQSESHVSSPEWWDRPYSPHSHDGDFQPED